MIQTYTFLVDNTYLNELNRVRLIVKSSIVSNKKHRSKRQGRNGNFTPIHNGQRTRNLEAETKTKKGNMFFFFFFFE